MFGLISTIYLIIILSTCNGDSKCPKDAIDFETKIRNSSIVAFGKTMGKILDNENDSTFRIEYHINCIFKGPAVSRKINITRVDRKKNIDNGCQEFQVGEGYSIAFLEPNPSSKNDTQTFVPSGFMQMSYETNTTDELLANTCHLEHILPYDSSSTISDMCPRVSTSPTCSQTTVNTELLNSASGIIIPSGTQNGTDFIRSKSGTIQVDVDRSNAMKTQNSILLIFLSLVFVQ